MRPTYKEFDIVKELGQLPFSKTDIQERETIIKALKDGEKVSVDLKQGSNIERMSLVAMPHLGVINVINGQGDKVSIANNQMRVIGKDEKPELTQTTKDLLEHQHKAQEQGQQQQRQGRRAS